jgi:hypothetical protein
MSKIKVTARDRNLLILGVLLSFFVQIFYDMLHEGILNQNGVWVSAQFFIEIILMVLIFIIVVKLNK